MSDGGTPAVPVPSLPRPGVANIRIDGPAEVIDAALVVLEAAHGDAWQPSTRKPSRYAGGGQVQYGTLIVPLPATATAP